jgi:hypothetical protein
MMNGSRRRYLTQIMKTIDDAGDQEKGWLDVFLSDLRMLGVID